MPLNMLLPFCFIDAVVNLQANGLSADSDFELKYLLQCVPYHSYLSVLSLSRRLIGPNIQPS